MKKPNIGGLYKCTFDTKSYHSDNPDDMNMKDKLVILLSHGETSHDGDCKVKVYSIVDQAEYNKILFINELQEIE